MSKRFTETTKWNKPWFRKLSPKHKCVWFYILDNCDNAGILDLDIESLSFMIGEDVKKDELISIFNKHITVISDYKIYINDFVAFQYGVLSDNNNAHKSVIQKHKKFDIEGLMRSSRGGQDKDKDKEKDIFLKKEDLILKKEAETNAKDISYFNGHYFADFVSKTMLSLDTGLILLAPKVDLAFGGEGGFNEWFTSVSNSKSWEAMDRNGQISYFKKALKDELKFRGAMK